MSNNAIQNAKTLSRVEKHNYRKYDNNQDDIVIIKGTSYLSQDVKDLYLELFEESRIAYNEKQTRKARMIDNYFNSISNNDFKGMNKLSVLLENVDNELESSKKEIKILTENNEALTLRNNTLTKNIETKDKKIKELKKENKTIMKELEFWKERFLNIIRFIKDKMFRNKKERNTYIDIATKLNNKKLITDEMYDDIYDNYKWIEENEESKEFDDNLEI